MNRKLLLAISAALLYADIGFASPRLQNDGKPAFGVACVLPSERVKQFLQAVDRGELRLFGKILARADIRPLQVEQHYSLGNHLQIIIIHAQLVRPLPMAGQAGLEIRAVSSELDSQGQIIETKAHVYADKTQLPES